MIPRTEFLIYEGKLECGCTIAHSIMLGVGSATTLTAAADIMRTWREDRIARHSCALVSAENPTGVPRTTPGDHHAG